MLGHYILVLSVLLSVVVGLIVVSQNAKSAPNRVYAALTFSFILLSIANFLSLEPSSSQFLYVKTVMASSTAAVYLIWLIVIAIKDDKLFNTRFRKILLISTIIIGVLDFTPIIFAGNIQGSPAQPIPGPGVFLYFLHFLFMVSVAARELYKGVMDKNAEKKKAEQYRYVLIGLLPILILAPATGFVLPLLFHQSQLIVLTPMYSFFFVACVGYAMVRHGLFDVRLAAIRTVAYVLAIATLAAIYYLLAYLVSAFLFRDEAATSLSISPINIFLALILAFIFQPLKRFFDKATNRVFYRDTYSSEDFFARLSELLASTTDLRGLLERASKEISNTIKAEQCFFFVYYTNSVSHYVSSGTKGHARLAFHDAQLLNKFSATHHGEVFVTELLTEKDEEIRRLLVSYKAAIFIPLRHKNNVIGHLLLGDRLTSGYTKRDIKVLGTIVDNLVIAIQNALSVHEVREINASLLQRIDAATAELRESNAQLHRLDAVKDEFVSMASHQLRTPLTSIKGYISLILDGDVGKITEAQRNALEEAFNSSERMVRLIGDFLSVSRLQTGKFIIEKKPVDLVKVVTQEVNSLRLIASTHSQKITFKPPKTLPVMTVDEAKLRQVMMNFMDNAVYYSRDKSTIHVTLSQLEDEIIFTVEDSGIGVPVEEQKKLFSKFFRATNARQQRPDGTGVGLFLAKKVIGEHHGKIIFSSVEGQGSTFGFRIPLDQKTNDAGDDKKKSK